MDAEDEVELIEAELDVYEMFAKAHCAGAALKQPMCEELRDRVRGLESQARGQSVPPRSAAVPAARLPLQSQWRFQAPGDDFCALGWVPLTPLAPALWPLAARRAVRPGGRGPPRAPARVEHLRRRPCTVAGRVARPRRLPGGARVDALERHAPRRGAHGGGGALPLPHQGERLRRRLRRFASHANERLVRAFPRSHASADSHSAPTRVPRPRRCPSTCTW